MTRPWNRFLAAAISVWCAAALPVLSAPRAAAASATAVTTDYLNLREGAGTNTKVLLTLGKNVAVAVLDNADPQWAKVRTASGKTGYCFKQYLNMASGSGGASASGSSAKTTDNLNLRQSASLSGKILSVLPKGTSLAVLDNSNADWVKVQTAGGGQGWCSRRYLTVSGASSPAGAETAGGSATAKTTDYLNLREGAGVNYKVLLTMAKGVSVAVLDNSNAGWVRVRTQGGMQGWCSRQYLTISGGAGTGSSSAPPSASPQSSSSGSSSSSPSSGGQSDPGGEEGDGDGEGGAAGITGATVTADVLRLRAQPNTSSQILANLVNGTGLQVLGEPASGWVRVRAADGKTGYVSTDYVKIQYSDGASAGGGTAGTGTAADSLSLSSGTQSIPAGKTLYLKAATNPSGADVDWESSNSDVATVVNGYVTAVGKGEAVITAKSGSASASCGVTVTEAEPVRTAFASPNIAGPGETVTLTAVTDLLRDGVRFVVTDPDGRTETISATDSVQETAEGVVTKKWTAKTALTQAGGYSVLVQSGAGGAWSSTGFTTSAYVTTKNDRSAATEEERRVSDEMIALISKWEGYAGRVYTDAMSSSQMPTIGYGCTLGQNAVFYNGISETEAWSLMVNRINGSSFTSDLNKMIRDNQFLMNQYQADCLISFAYNVGSGYFNSSNEMDFIKIMKNAVRPPDFSGSTSYEATVTKDTAVRAASGILSGETGSVAAGTAVIVTGGDFSDKRDGWYKAELPDGTTGWINSGYVSLGISASLVHDLSYTNAYAFGTELIRWNQAGGKFYAGLFYRRLGEANVYNYGDYSAVRYNKYNYGYPGSASSLE